MNTLFSQLGRCLRVPGVQLPRRTVAPAFRTFHSSPAVLQTFQDPDRPSLFYHLLPAADYAPRYFALSFLPHPPSTPSSRTILGFLPAVPDDGGGSEQAAPQEGDGLGLNDFRENSGFLGVLHQVLKEGVLKDEGWTGEAVRRGEGYMPIFDMRNPPMPSRTPEPEDTIAMVEVKNGLVRSPPPSPSFPIVPSTYEPMPTYRLCTPDGILTLSDTLEWKLVDHLSQIAEKEKQAAERGPGKRPVA
ncbi:hypothetical protein CALCODRAFT_466230 [Calocera cornea HHB12733]|uniref:Uncharacterized protein n=1 Tax=Calocera cornea HHB12733 TaxID=1353952 RepID=A0A165I2J1_9BASI|nr:hypothetical protein CALCODRAFT_466230 [Calocera cornea HHB12733]